MKEPEKLKYRFFLSQFHRNFFLSLLGLTTMLFFQNCSNSFETTTDFPSASLGEVTEESSVNDNSGSSDSSLKSCTLNGQSYEHLTPVPYYTLESGPGESCKNSQVISQCDGLTGQLVPSPQNQVFGFCSTSTNPQIPQVLQFELSHPVIQAGGSSQIRWKVSDATQVELIGFGPVSLEGERDLTANQNTSYTLKATNPHGTIEKTLILVVRSGNTGQWPSWRKSMGAFQWKQIPGTSIDGVKTKNVIHGGVVDFDGKSIAGTPRGRILGAWNGLAANTLTNRVYSAANGGHADYAGNEVYEIDFSLDQPKWTLLIEPTAAKDIRASNHYQNRFFHYYADGRPSSTHTYYALQFIESKNSVFKFGAGSIYGTGNEKNSNTDAFSLTKNDWEREGTYPRIVSDENQWAPNISLCKNLKTEEVYIAAPGSFKRFNPKTNSYGTLANYPSSTSYQSYKRKPCVVDTKNNRVLFLGNTHYRPHTDRKFNPRGGAVYDITNDTFTLMEFSGPATNSNRSWDESYAWFNETLGKIILKPVASDQVIQIDPVSFVTTFIQTSGGSAMPNSANGVQTRFQYLPKLKGFVHYPGPLADGWFLSLE